MHSTSKINIFFPFYLSHPTFRSSNVAVNNPNQTTLPPARCSPSTSGTLTWQCWPSSASTRTSPPRSSSGSHPSLCHAYVQASVRLACVMWTDRGRGSTASQPCSFGSLWSPGVTCPPSWRGPLPGARPSYSQSPQWPRVLPPSSTWGPRSPLSSTSTPIRDQTLRGDGIFHSTLSGPLKYMESNVQLQLQLEHMCIRNVHIHFQHNIS